MRAIDVVAFVMFGTLWTYGTCLLCRVYASARTRGEVVQVFRLHEDGGEGAEIDRKNAALHEFFHSCDKVDFEGGGGDKGDGITIWMSANPGDFLVRYRDGSMRVVRGDADV